MGSINCSKCIEEFEKESTNSVIFIKAILNAYNTLHESELPSLGTTRELDFFSPDPMLEFILKIQHAWRIYQAKKNLLNLKSVSLSSSYFPPTDVRLTTTRRFSSTSRKKREKFLYPSGGIYEGEAKGGFRDGYGKISWPNGSSYEGNWSYGYPSGYGKFVYSDKEFYEGRWVNPFPFGKQSISSSTMSFDGTPVYSDGYGKV